MGKRTRYTTLILALCVIVAATSAFMPVVSRAQSLESARESYEQGNYTEAEEELREILAADSENNEALSLLREIELHRRKDEAAALTNRALIEINSRNFREAYALLERALILDPENRQARELYLSIHEVLQVEGGTVDEVL
jgi:tetratricopeptide (TPR) repeat protein